MRVLLIALFAGFASLALASCHHDSDENQVRATIAQAATAARANDSGGVLDVVAKDFTGNDGDFDRRGLRQLLALRALRHDTTGVLIGPISIERQSDRLIAKLTLTLTGGKPDSLLPDQAAVYAMTAAWRREDSHWRCYSATWSRKL